MIRSVPQVKTMFDHYFSTFIQNFYTQENRLAQACHYALSGEGKRIRPLLSLLSCQAVGGEIEHALESAVALELIHTYSLVHDDLPAMDDDALRRGRPTVHIAFDEATAILTGDALLTDAFSLLSGSCSHASQSLSAAQRITLIKELSFASGSQGMVLGQIFDMEWTARGGYSLQDLEKVHLEKTGKLIMAACISGPLSAGLETNIESEAVEIFRKIGALIGLSFQMVDDLLDSSPETGKSQGKDLSQGKLTYLKLFPPSVVRDMVFKLLEEARTSINFFGARAAPLMEFMADLERRVR